MLTFNEKDHKYFWNGQPVPGVNEILTELNMQEGWGSEADLLRGTWVHQACQYYDEGTLDQWEFDPVILGYLEGWKKFRVEQCPRPPVMIEKMMYTSYGFAGRVDRLIGHIVVDIKTGEPGWIAGLKLAAYQILIEGTIWGSERPNPGSIKRCAVKLNADGTYKLYWYTNRKDKDLFLSCVSLYHYKKNGGK